MNASVAQLRLCRRYGGGDPRSPRRQPLGVPAHPSCVETRNEHVRCAIAALPRRWERGPEVFAAAIAPRPCSPLHNPPSVPPSGEGGKRRLRPAPAGPRVHRICTRPTGRSRYRSSASLRSSAESRLVPPNAVSSWSASVVTQPALTRTPPAGYQFRFSVNVRTSCVDGS